MRLSGEMAARDRAAFVGRERELAVLTGLLDPDSPRRLAFVTGLPGVGKSALLRELRRRAEQLGRDEALVTVEDAGGGLDELTRLPLGSALVVAARERPDPSWWTSPWASSAVLLDVEPLPAADARRLLAAQGVTDPEEVDELVRWADGLPLALTVAAAARAGTPGPLDQTALDRLERDVLDHQTDGLLAGPGLLTRDRLVLAVASLAPAVDAALLGDVLPDTASGADAERWLRGLPFTERVGLRVGVPHRLRRLMVHRLRDEDPEMERMLRLRIVDHLADAAGGHRANVVVDLREVLAPPVDRGVAPSMVRGPGWAVTGVRAGDAEALARLMASRDPGHVQWVQRWLRDAPDHVIVVRRPEDAADVAGVAVWLTPASMPEPFRNDSGLAAWLAWASAADPTGSSLVNPVTEVLITGRAAEEVGTLLLHALAERCGLPNFRHWLTTRSPGAPDPTHCEGVRVPDLDLDFGTGVVEGWVIDYGQAGVVPSMQARAHAELGPVGDPAPAASDEAGLRAVVRTALRDFHDPLSLARSPLARGADPAERAAYVAALLRDAIDRAFGDSPGARLHREALVRGYLDVDSDHTRAMRALHLSRTTYFRRVREATAQLAAWLEATPTAAQRPTTGQRAET